MEALILVGIGGAIGSLMRFWLSRLQPICDIPAGTLAVNVSGSLAISLLAFSNISSQEYAFFCTGILGGYTTFSTFGFETFRLLEDKLYPAAIANILLNVVGSLAGVFIGYLLIIR